MRHTTTDERNGRNSSSESGSRAVKKKSTPWNSGTTWNLEFVPPAPRNKKEYKYCTSSYIVNVDLAIVTKLKRALALLLSKGVRLVNFGGLG